MSDPFRKKMKGRCCRVELSGEKSLPYHVAFRGVYRGRADMMGRWQGSEITLATHKCRYEELKDIIDQWIDQAKLPTER